MRIIRQKFEVSHQYPVYFTNSLFKPENDSLTTFFQQYASEGIVRRLLVIIDSGVVDQHDHIISDIDRSLKAIPGIKLVSHPLIIPGGEQAKNNEEHLQTILNAINEFSIDRHSFVMAVGGGSLLDLVGFASSVAHRGVFHIRIPTTVLSQNDSGVGVKNGINYFGKKNFLGSFTPPVAVFNDSHFLTTLDDRDWRSGIAEAVKVALIKDGAFFDWIEVNTESLNRRDPVAMDELIFRCAELHVSHIAGGDPFESGSSRPLDFGHWAAHKLEQLSDFSLRHGEAVAIGMAVDVVYSGLIGWLGDESVKRILELLNRLNFSLYDTDLESDELTDGLREFREHLGGKLTIMLLKKIGKGENIHEMDSKLIKKAIGYLKTHYQNKQNVSQNKSFHYL